MSNPIDNSGSRINSGNVRGAVRNESAGAREGSEADEVRRQPGNAGDTQVASERLQAVRARIDQTPEVDAERVESIKRDIAEGRYPVDPERIAEKFIELESLLRD